MDDEKTQRDWLTPAEAAAELDASVESVKRWYVASLAAGRNPPRTPGGHYRIPRTWVARMKARLQSGEEVPHGQ